MLILPSERIVISLSMVFRAIFRHSSIWHDGLTCRGLQQWAVSGDGRPPRRLVQNAEVVKCTSAEAIQEITQYVLQPYSLVPLLLNPIRNVFKHACMVDARPSNQMYFSWTLRSRSWRRVLRRRLHKFPPPPPQPTRRSQDPPQTEICK